MSLGVIARPGGGGVRETDLRLDSYYGAATGAWSDRAPARDEQLWASWGETTGDLHVNQAVYRSASLGAVIELMSLISAPI
jgi:hypothetical protein